MERPTTPPDIFAREKRSPRLTKTKQRLGRYIEDSVPGRSNAEIRGLAVKAIELAQSVKHRQTPTRRDADIAADAVVLVDNTLRRLEQNV